MNHRDYSQTNRIFGMPTSCIEYSDLREIAEDEIDFIQELGFSCDEDERLEQNGLLMLHEMLEGKDRAISTPSSPPLKERLGLTNRIAGMIYNNKTHEDNLTELAEQTFGLINACGFSKIPEQKLMEQGLVIISSIVAGKNPEYRTHNFN